MRRYCNDVQGEAFLFRRAFSPYRVPRHIADEAPTLNAAAPGDIKLQNVHILSLDNFI